MSRDHQRGVGLGLACYVGQLVGANAVHGPFAAAVRNCLQPAFLDSTPDRLPAHGCTGRGFGFRQQFTLRGRVAGLGDTADQQSGSGPPGQVQRRRQRD